METSRAILLGKIASGLIANTEIVNSKTFTNEEDKVFGNPLLERNICLTALSMAHMLEIESQIGDEIAKNITNLRLSEASLNPTCTKDERVLLDMLHDHMESNIPPSLTSSHVVLKMRNPVLAEEVIRQITRIYGKKGE